MTNKKKEFDRMLKRACESYPQPSQAQIDGVKNKIMNKTKTHRLRPAKFARYAAAAACVAIAMFIAMPSGRAAAGRLYRHIFPDKNNQSISIEGNSEKLNYRGVVVEYPSGSSLVDYGIYVDQKSYSVKNEDGNLTITPADYTEEDMKETPVYMTVVQTTKSVTEAFEEETAKVKAKKPVEFRLNSETSLSAQWFSYDNYQWDGDMETISVIDNGNGGSFVITTHYFAECVEGHAVRLADMEKTLTIF